MRTIMILGLSLCLISIAAGNGYGFIAKSGSVAKLRCGGSFEHLIANGIDGTIRTRYRVSNYSDTATINIDRIVVYDKDGVVRCDITSPGQLAPHQTGDFSTGDMASGGDFGCQNPIASESAGNGSIQVIIYWSGGKHGDLIASSTGFFLDTTNNNFSFQSLKCE